MNDDAILGLAEAVAHSSSNNGPISEVGAARPKLNLSQIRRLLTAQLQGDGDDNADVDFQEEDILQDDDFGDFEEEADQITHTELDSIQREHLSNLPTLQSHGRERGETSFTVTHVKNEPRMHTNFELEPTPLIGNTLQRPSGNENKRRKPLPSVLSESYTPQATHVEIKLDIEQGKTAETALRPSAAELMASTIWRCNYRSEDGTECNRVFPRLSNLRLHRRSHGLMELDMHLSTGARLSQLKRHYHCPHSGCKYNKNRTVYGVFGQIREHYRRHGAKIYPCERCGKLFAIRKDVNSHAKSCGTKKFRCSCGVSLATKRSRRLHITRANAHHPGRHVALDDLPNLVEKKIVPSTSRKRLQTQSSELRKKVRLTSSSQELEHTQSPLAHSNRRVSNLARQGVSSNSSLSFFKGIVN
ncbi:hypothetical protein AAMO2058_000515600 [Amorphochlora amoebiformis]|eukprot:1333737-Amorphochlora_amoeboformis.AAC.1